MHDISERLRNTGESSGGWLFPILNALRGASHFGINT
jgi:hypothetical protein